VYFVSVSTLSSKKSDSSYACVNRALLICYFVFSKNLQNKQKQSYVRIFEFEFLGIFNYHSLHYVGEIDVIFVIENQGLL
jgi:hypothetical protein